MLLATLAIATAMISNPSSLDSYDVVWNTPSKDAAGSMPIGNGEVVLNAWVEEATGDLLFYIARTDALSEISRFLKLGRVRVHTEPSLFKDTASFRQHLVLRNGVIELTSDKGKMELFVDADADVVFVRGTSSSPVAVSARLESWRDKPRTLPKNEQGSAWSVHDAPFELVESADVVQPGRGQITWFHRNETSVVPKLWENQSLTGLNGRFDPLLHRTFGGRMQASGFSASGNELQARDRTSFELAIATASKQTETVEEWQRALPSPIPAAKALARTQRWWNAFWDRSWVFATADVSQPVPDNDYQLLISSDRNRQNLFAGVVSDFRWEPFARPPSELRVQSHNPAPRGLTLVANVRPRALEPGRIFDKITPGQHDGFLFDLYPAGGSLRLIVGDLTLVSPPVLKVGVDQHVAATFNAGNGEAAIYYEGKRVAHRPPSDPAYVSRGYLLQRYVQACQGRGAYPIKFNGGFYTVEPTAMGLPFNPDHRNWGDCHWFQNVRHMYHPMLATGDVEMTDPFFELYEKARPLAESRSKFYHGTEGAYFPETMSVFGTYSGGDYGWDRKGHEPKEVLSPWWDDAWNQGPELVALMLDRWDYTRDEKFLRERVLTMAESILRYFDTRFKKDARGKIVLDPTQVVETYWEGVVNDMPSAAGLIAITDRLTSLPPKLVTAEQRSFFDRMKKAAPELPLESHQGFRQLAPAEKYVPKASNVENGELYGVWPFRLVTLARPELMVEAKRAYRNRKNHLDNGWGYDGNVAALLGLTDEAARILRSKANNSHPAYRWPATWGPNFDWLPDQNHGGNLLNTTNLMLMQAEPMEQGGAIRLLPAWPKTWDVSFKLHAPGNTVVECVYRGGKIQSLQVTPASRRKDVIAP